MNNPTIKKRVCDRCGKEFFETYKELLCKDCMNELGWEYTPKTNADHIRSMTDEELADFMCELAYGRKTPWSEPFARKFCDNCPTVHGTYESGQEDDFTECNFVDGKCPHGSDTVWWLKQPYKEDGYGKT